MAIDEKLIDLDVGARYAYSAVGVRGAFEQAAFFQFCDLAADNADLCRAHACRYGGHGDVERKEKGQHLCYRFGGVDGGFDEALP